MALTTLQKQTYPLLSSYVSLEFVLGNLLADDNGWVNPFDKRFLQLLELPRTVQLVYNSGEPITSQSYDLYGTTSLWTLILACSDFFHPHDIPHKTLIRVPGTTDLLSTIKRNAPDSLAGKTITF